jgi:hypothetical protein
VGWLIFVIQEMAGKREDLEEVGIAAMRGNAVNHSNIAGLGTNLACLLVPFEKIMLARTSPRDRIRNEGNYSGTAEARLRVRYQPINLPGRTVQIADIDFRSTAITVLIL